MPSITCDRAIEDCFKFGKALLKYISPNDTGSTNSHQYGYYLPKNPWKMFSPHAPIKGRNDEHYVTIFWHDGRETSSCIHWYGKDTRSEYRLTRFGQGFPWRTEDRVGDLLVLIPVGAASFHAFVLTSEDDISDLQSALGIEVIGTWAVWDSTDTAPPETRDDCIWRLSREFSESVSVFPSCGEMTGATLRIVRECVRSFEISSPDQQIMMLRDNEYALFRQIEERLCKRDIEKSFKSIDDFLSIASTITNRRKSRAGRALENHVEFVLSSADLPHDMRPKVDGEPDVLIPGKKEYSDKSYPDDKLFMLGVKTTCKDRWRQVLNEAKRVKYKHLLTVQPSISRKQLMEMREANLTLVVPQALLKDYPKGNALPVISLAQFVSDTRTALQK